MQMKIHLDKTEAEVFRMLPEGERGNFDRAIEALTKTFRPVVFCLSQDSGNRVCV